MIDHVDQRRHTIRRTGQLKHAFLEQFRHYGNVTTAAKLAGINRQLVYAWQEADDEFATAFRMADLEATEVLEQEARRRGVEGNPYERTSYWRGEPVGTDRKIEYSDNLLLALLRARAPERYRERAEVQVTTVIKSIGGVDPASVL
jgi:hypothetical protein